MHTCYDEILLIVILQRKKRSSWRSVRIEGTSLQRNLLLLLLYDDVRHRYNYLYLIQLIANLLLGVLKTIENWLSIVVCQRPPFISIIVIITCIAIIKNGTRSKERSFEIHPFWGIIAIIAGGHTHEGGGRVSYPSSITFSFPTE